MLLLHHAIAVQVLLEPECTQVSDVSWITSRKMLLALLVILVPLLGIESQHFGRICQVNHTNIDDANIIKRIMIVSEIECASRCSREHSCIGFNFLKTTVVSTYNCELLNRISNCSQVEESEGWQLYVKVRITSDTLPLDLITFYNISPAKLQL